MEKLPLEIFADAMLVGLGRTAQLTPAGSYKPEDIFTKEDIDFKIELEKATFGMCGLASIVTAHYLSEYPHIFDRVILLSSHVGKFHNPIWKWHQVVLAKAQEGGEWFAGSPGNYSTREESNHAERIIHGTLRTIPAELKAKIGGIWPTPEDIDKHLTKYSPPRRIKDPLIDRFEVDTIATFQTPMQQVLAKIGFTTEHKTARAKLEVPFPDYENKMSVLQYILRKEIYTNLRMIRRLKSSLANSRDSTTID
jgi:hypothetical protein